MHILCVPLVTCCCGISFTKLRAYMQANLIIYINILVDMTSSANRIPINMWANHKTNNIIII